MYLKLLKYLNKTMLILKLLGYNKAIEINPNFALAHNNKKLAIEGLKKSKV